MPSPPTFAVVAAFRDRDLERVGRFLDSLADQTCQDFQLLFVDYGSELSAAHRTRERVSRYSFCAYLYSDTRGRPWNRSHALNTGARCVDSPYLMTTDVDMVFPAEFLDRVLDRIHPKRVLHCAPLFLPRGFSDWQRLDLHRDSLRSATETALGACQIVSTSAFNRLRGFDETYRYWGIEDRDIHLRFVRMGLEVEWLNDITCMFHQWHPEVNWTTQDFMPEGLWPRMQTYFFQHRDCLVRNSETWGRLLDTSERPVLSFLDFESFSLSQSERLVSYRGPVDSNRGLGHVVDRFWNLPSGHALALPGSSVRSSRRQKGPLSIAGRVLRRLDPSTRISSSLAPLRSFLDEFLSTAAQEISDYYLDFPSRPPTTLLVRR